MEIHELEKEIRALKERNLRVEADKAWEVSIFRVATITIITYIVAVIVFKLIGVKNYFLNALIPTIGYYLSTQSLPVIKRWWVNNFLGK